MKMLDFTLFESMSSAVRSTLIIVVVLSIVFILVGLKVKKLDPKETPKGFIFLCISIVDGFNQFISQYMAGKKFKFFGPYLFTIAVFLAFANTLSLFGLTPPLANLGVALSFTVMTFFAIKIAEIKYLGVKNKLWGLLGDVKPMAPIMLPINLIGEISTPFSMGLRLFVNLLSGMVVAAMVYAVLHWVAGIFAGVLLHAIFDIFFGLIQAFVFLMLSTINISMAAEA
ncbi:F0F1 ATP synthase subunit A [Mycoplasmatota bacterium]|nr:F0F1 ATP synthase subunit A [Mycoplasmatota bacterium]